MKKFSITSQDETPAAPSRRQLLKSAALLGLAALPLTATAASAQQYGRRQISKRQAYYRSQPYGGASCAGCAYYNGNGGCQVVQGEVSASGFCRYFTPRAGGAY